MKSPLHYLLFAFIFVWAIYCMILNIIDWTWSKIWNK